MEKEALGFYITGHPLNKYQDILAELACTTTHELHELKDKQEINLCGLVRDSKQIQIKRTGDLMAYITLEDMYGTVEVILFPELYRDSQSVISQETPVIIAGHTDNTDKGLKVIAQKIVSIDDREQIKKANGGIKFSREITGETERSDSISNGSGKKYKTLTITMNRDAKPDAISKLDSILSKYNGDCPVYLKIISPSKWESVFSTNRQVLPSEEMIREAESVLGEGKAKWN
jgi:DNA polymerase-3 subunit alpha